MIPLNKLFIGFAALSSLALCSCSDDDENLTPGPVFPNFFEVDPSDNSEEAKMRREFYDRTGIYLQFNDTLAYYTDYNGIERAETVDFGWNLTSSTGNRYRYDYIKNSSEAKQTASMIEKYFIPYINIKDGTLRPYSITIFNSIEEYNSYSDSWKSLEYVSCIRSFGISGGSWIDVEESEAKELGKTLLRKLVDAKVDETNDALADFFAVSGDLYDSSPYEEFPNWENEQDITLVYEAGFTTYYPDSWGDPSWDSFPYENTDLRLFKDAIFNEDETEFREKWADYPKIILKYDLLKECLINLGIDFNAVK